MKKIFMTFSAVATFSAAIVLTSCNNAEQVKKQTEEQNAKIQSAVDEKLNGLNEEVGKACTARVDSLATVAFTAWQAEEAKAHKGKKPTPKPAPKPKDKPKAEVPKKGDNKVIGTKDDANNGKIVGTKGDGKTDKIVGTK
ncbi:MAG: hypothetical protein NTY88_10275 [Bacteroidetes bacterium]|nr:hypothetical protein [Bacteroidota bacterium]